MPKVKAQEIAVALKISSASAKETPRHSDDRRAILNLKIGSPILEGMIAID